MTQSSTVNLRKMVYVKFTMFKKIEHSLLFVVYVSSFTDIQHVFRQAIKNVDAKWGESTIIELRDSWLSKAMMLVTPARRLTAARYVAHR